MINLVPPNGVRTISFSITYHYIVITIAISYLFNIQLQHKHNFIHIFSTIFYLYRIIIIHYKFNLFYLKNSLTLSTFHAYRKIFLKKPQFFFLLVETSLWIGPWLWLWDESGRFFNKLGVVALLWVAFGNWEDCCCGTKKIQNISINMYYQLKNFSLEAQCSIYFYW